MFFDRLTGTGLIGAHRGARSLAPENTLFAAQKARACNAHFWEMDVHMVADGEVVVFHDPTLERTTDIESREGFRDRKPWNIHEFTGSELKTLNAGSFFLETDPYGTVAAGEIPEEDRAAIGAQRIPTLRETLEFTKQHDLPMNLEIKDQTGHASHESIVRAVLDLVADTGTEGLILFSSFNHEYMRQIKKQAPHLPTAALQEDGHPEDLSTYLHSLGVSAYHPDHRFTTPGLIREMRDEGIHVIPWTVNDETEARTLLDAGAKAIITDFPQRM